MGRAALLLAVACCLAACAAGVPSRAPKSTAPLPDADPNLRVARAASADPLDLAATPQEDWAEDVTKGDDNPSGAPDPTGATTPGPRGSTRLDPQETEDTTPPVWIGINGAPNPNQPSTTPPSTTSGSSSSGASPGGTGVTGSGGRVTPPDSNVPLTDGDSSSSGGEEGGQGAVLESRRVVASPSERVPRPSPDQLDKDMPPHTTSLPDDSAGAAAMAAERAAKAEAAAAAAKATAAAQAGQEGVGASRRLLALNGTGSNQPGSFTGGPTLTTQHSAWALSDSPDKVATTAPNGSITSSGTNATLDANVLRSINQDLRLFLTYGGRTGRRRAQLRRRLLAARQAAGGAATGGGGGPASRRRLLQEDEAWPSQEAEEAAAAAAGAEGGKEEEQGADPEWGDPDEPSTDPDNPYQPHDQEDFHIDAAAAAQAAAQVAALNAALMEHRAARVGILTQDTPGDLAVSEEEREYPRGPGESAAGEGESEGALPRGPEGPWPTSGDVGAGGTGQLEPPPQAQAQGEGAAAVPQGPGDTAPVEESQYSYLGHQSDKDGRPMGGSTLPEGMDTLAASPALTNAYEKDDDTPEASPASSPELTNSYEKDAGPSPIPSPSPAAPHKHGDQGDTPGGTQPQPTPAPKQAEPASAQPQPERVEGPPAKEGTKKIEEPVPTDAVPKDSDVAAATNQYEKACLANKTCDANPDTATGSVLGGKAARAKSKTDADDQVLPDDPALLGPPPSTRKASRKLMGRGQTTGQTSGQTVGQTAGQMRALPVGTAGKPLYGVTYGWRRAEDCDGTRRVCTCPHPDDLEQDLDLLHRYSARVRTYSAECPELLSMLGHYLAATAPPGVGGGAGGGGAWFLGVWLGPSDAANQQQLRRLAQLLEAAPEASRYYAIIVGNEVMSRQDMSEATLLGYLAQVRGLLSAIAVRTNTPALATVPITTTDAPWALTPRLVAAIDILSVVVQPFYETPLDATKAGWEVRAVTGVTSTLKRLGARWGKPVVVAEIGWPSASGGADTNVGSTATARAFAAAWTQAASKEGIPYFYHELADASWKTVLREPGVAAAAVAAAATQQGKVKKGVDLKPKDVLADEHFGLVSADRLLDKELLSPGGGMGRAIPAHTKGEVGAPLNTRGHAAHDDHDHSGDGGGSKGSTSTAAGSSTGGTVAGTVSSSKVAKREEADAQVAGSRRRSAAKKR